MSAPAPDDGAFGPSPVVPPVEGGAAAGADEVGELGVGVEEVLAEDGVAGADDGEAAGAFISLILSELS